MSEGRERGATSPDSALPSPDPLRGPPSPAEGGGRNRSAAQVRRRRRTSMFSPSTPAENAIAV
ncbi:hypothetical protein FV232_23250 [Methylobacterium sp. WL30]|nr:hypothetical protein FV223_17900 [Methylobacterium sp. WL116]TXN63448.1 hypothetical protein FV232_23250 [Methylobacterium sp. WL30]